MKPKSKFYQNEMLNIINKAIVDLQMLRVRIHNDEGVHIFDKVVLKNRISDKIESIRTTNKLEDIVG